MHFWRYPKLNTCQALLHRNLNYFFMCGNIVFINVFSMPKRHLLRFINDLEWEFTVFWDVFLRKFSSCENVSFAKGKRTFSQNNKFSNFHVSRTGPDASRPARRLASRQIRPAGRLGRGTEFRDGAGAAPGLGLSDVGSTRREREARAPASCVQ